VIGDDLTGLFGGPPAPDSGFRQGTVQAFDPESGENTIAVAGGVLTDVDVLNIGDLVRIVPGDVVVLLRLRSSWAILGRILPVGSGQLTIGLTDTEVDNDFAFNFAITTAFVTRASVTFTVPEWANSALVFASMSATCHNTGTAQSYAAQILVDGATSGALGTQADVGVQRNTSISYARGNDGPGSTVLVEAQLKSAASTIPVHVSNAAILTAMAIFRKVQL
jgi:hypothetical protein